MNDTDDDKQVDGSDEGAIPSTSTNLPDDVIIQVDRPKAEMYGSIFRFAEKTRGYYYTQQEWDRTVGYGKVPDERNRLLLNEKCDIIDRDET